MTANTGVHTCSYYCERPECIKRQRDELRDRMEAVLAAPQQPAAGDGCHCGTCTCNPNMTPAVRFDLSPAQMEGAIRDHLIRLGWTPPDERAMSQQPEARGVGEAAPPSAPEPEVHSYDPTDQRESVTIRWPDGKCLGYVLDRTRYTDNLPPSAPVGVDFAAVASILRRAMRDGAHYGYRREFILQQALALEAIAQQPAAVDAGLAQRIQALVGGVEVDLEAPLSADANATSQTHGAMLRQLEPQLQEQLEEYEYTIAAQEAEIDALHTRLEDTVRDSTNEIEALKAEAEQHFQQAMSNGAKARAAQAQADNLRTEVDALRAEVEKVTCELMDAITRADKLEDELREAREFRDKMVNAIGNDQLRRFIEKHGEPVPLTIRMQEAEARAERLAEALRRYRNEVPIGHQPHMLAHEVDDLLREQEDRNE